MQQWAEAAEKAVCRRYCGTLRYGGTLWSLPGTVLARPRWPEEPLWSPENDTTKRLRTRRPWHYWWHAHLLDCLVDAELRSPSRSRRGLINRVAHTVFLRNRLRWTNNYYDDMAWMGLALQRVGSVTRFQVRRPINTISAQLFHAWTPDAGGGLWWRRNDNYKNTPTNGPAGILHAREGNTQRAREILHWLEKRLVDAESGIVFDGINAGSGELNRNIYSYCQGVFLGLCLELSQVDVASRTIDAIARHCLSDGVIRGQGGGDGGLFGGILARYLAVAAQELSGDASQRAREIVMNSAISATKSSLFLPNGPLFSPEWTNGVLTLSFEQQVLTGDLSVQLGSWMLLEAAAKLDSVIH